MDKKFSQSRMELKRDKQTQGVFFKPKGLTSKQKQLKQPLSSADAFTGTVLIMFIIIVFSTLIFGIYYFEDYNKEEQPKTEKTSKFKIVDPNSTDNEEVIEGGK